MHGKNIKKIKILLVLLLTTAIFTACGENKTEELSKLSLLNSKYGLIEVESLNTEDSTKVASFFLADLMKTDVMNSMKPQKEIIVKLDSDEEEYLQNMFLLKLRTDESFEEIVKNYEKLNLVSYAEPNFDLKLSAPAVVTKIKRKSINLQESVSVQKVEDAKEGVIVAVIDSGVDTNNDDFKGKIVNGWDFLKDKSAVGDSLGHGTHVAGIIVANSDAAKIMPLKFASANDGKMSDLVKAMKYAVDNNAKVINLSLGLEEKSKALKEAADYAANKNVAIVAAAGNYNSDKLFYPAAYADVFAVAALNSKGEKLFQSNYGKWVDYSAKAQDILSDLPNNKHGYKTGTSQAAPFISARIAEILSKNPEADLKEIRAELQRSSMSVPDEKFKGLLGMELIQ
jgi:subtilisin family serine protease